ncbi:MAG: lysine transporter LysE [Chitinophagia bacterium]|nr:lysine transporter LysE [Chitinophagia bacterium]
MMEAVLKGLAISLLLVFSVGPIVFTIIKQSIVNGRMGGFSFVAGIWLSDLLIVILSNVFSEAVTSLLHFKKAIGLTGSLFLLGMGIFYLFFKKLKLRGAEDSAVRISGGTHARLVIAGFFINILNPAVIAFWLTTATTLAIGNSVRDRIVIFSTCILVNFGADVGKVLLAGKLSKKLTHRNIELINKISGLLLLIFGIALFFGVLYSVTN